MRMRKKKHGEERLKAVSVFLTKPGKNEKCNPASLFNREDAPVFLEIGAGKGGFAIKMAKRYPEVSYLAMERVSDCVVLAAEAAASCEGGAPHNLKFIIENADNLAKLFTPGSIDAIFLNFSDPWSKKGYAKRRLTHRRYIALYMNLLKPGGVLRFKTDNEALFDFSLAEFLEVGLSFAKLTRDLHASEYVSDNIMTEYETVFSSQGVKINMLEVIKPEGFSIEISPEFLTEREEYIKMKGKA